MSQFGEFCDCSHSNVGMTDLISHWVMLYTQRLKTLELRSLSKYNWFFEGAELNREVLELSKSCDILSNFFKLVFIQDKFLKFWQFGIGMQLLKILKIAFF